MSAVRGLRKLSRVALLGAAPRDSLPDAIEHVAKVHRAHHPRADLRPLRRAYVLAESSHRGQMRKSGEPYITHPLAVTLLLAQLGAETTTLTASLLHDTVEDTAVTLDQVRSEFGDQVCYLVDGVTKLEKVDYGSAAEPETFRKMLLATGNDVRVMSIKLADRLHNMRTLGVMRREKQVRIAKVTSDVLIPLAERLGIQALKSELEDLVFAVLRPEEHRSTRELIREHNTRPDPLTGLAAQVRRTLRDAGVVAQVLIRPRHTVSVHRLRLKRGQLGDCDFARLLVLVDEDADCYATLGELHTCFAPLVSEFKDFIAVPKFNLYQSLHTAIADEDGRVAEVLVRTRRMHQVAETGVIALGDPHAAATAEAAHEGAAGAGAVGTGSAAEGDGTGERVDPTRPGWLSRLLEWQSDAPDPNTFWQELRDELAQDLEITVYCAVPGTEDFGSGPLPLPAGATCVDAAYARLGQDGHRCIGARVNGRLAALTTVLLDGDALQLFLEPSQGSPSGPSPQWLDHVRTPSARIAIRKWLAAHGEAAQAAADGTAAEPRVTAADDVTRPSGFRTAGNSGFSTAGNSDRRTAADSSLRTEADGDAQAAPDAAPGASQDVDTAAGPATDADTPVGVGTDLDAAVHAGAVAEPPPHAGATDDAGIGTAPAPGSHSAAGSDPEAAADTARAAAPEAKAASRTGVGPAPTAAGRSAVPAKGAGEARRDATAQHTVRGARGERSGRRAGHRGERYAENVPVVPGRPDTPVRLARCCTPVPTDAVTGFPVRGGAVTVHRDSCQSVARMASDGRLPLPVRWEQGAAGCRVTLRAEAFGRPRLLADLTETIAVHGAAVVAADVEPPREQRVRHTYTLQLPDAAGLPALMRAMRRVPGVYDVSRSARRAVVN
ncbi:RelA/SpoT family protein [Streptomyces reniochalinae]|uniref:RelA/SpoT family protein n=1 Tax=Streptomyces reniochalinae TaxID=2250578 RepID=UPI001FE53D7E|nr:HD domain-containing protein [Streptomyces reniochalinae]